MPGRRWSDLALTYHNAGSRQIVEPEGLLLNVPAGGLTATATDMAHLMIADVQDGRYGTAQLLRASTVQEMH
jgi:CubicO group peptidase (beta-lactamase class C family)